MSKRIYTLAEANRLVPELNRLFSELMQMRGQLRALYRKLETAGFAPDAESFEVDAPGAAEGVLADRAAFRGLVDLVKADLLAIQALGCEVKDLDTGLVDWIAVEGDREIYLCWKYGEREVGFWHELETGFPGRRPVSELKGPSPRRTLH